MKTIHCVLAFTLGFAQLALAERRGVIDDPEGSVNVRADKSAGAPVIATVETGEPFTFESEEDLEWSKVTLASGKSGWMPLNRIRLYFSEADLPTLEEDPAGPSEIDDAARAQGFDYAAGTRRAARGDTKALEKFFTVANDADGAAAESVAGVPAAVYHLLGDEKFAKFLAAQPLGYQQMVRNVIARDDLLPSASLYLRRHFPETTKILFRRELVDWSSPNQRYAIRKIFSNEFDLSASKVVRAELIDKKTGQVLCDLTPDDIGTGADREGEVLWSPDSKRFAYLSSDLTLPPGNLFSTPRPAPQRKQTVVYQVSGESFARVGLPLGEVPGRETDAELEGAILGHEYIEPIRWEKPAVLVLERHEYYEKLKPTTIDNVTFESIHPFDRWYQITATIGPDGKATLVWKPKTIE
jgi:hypothetical protein